MRPETRALKLLQAGNLPAQYALLSKPRKAYARELVASGYTARVAIQQAYIFSPERTKARRHYYAVWYAYADAISDSDRLYRFTSSKARASFCKEHQQAEPVTLAGIRHRFSVREFDRDSRAQYITQRPGYII